RMDNLHQAVSKLVEDAQSVHADPIETFFHIKALALEANDQEMCAPCAIRDYGTGKILPHLTESWFC
ncbi:MAG TPA: CUAEP/CCAEP-tail radical SAM protein, partial [Ktedonobacteraceae bacterium]|nr:CUAEP/CCAEP-tail radical SAM protein [Ktedonobacteraceae bacterium]